ncbi:DUF1360 domain-containing protein [Streptomyces sp. NPDC049879]|uniref:DUF1360 domain-containing protein n=1 Tax=Streptomyces sp. NPDC049879 TaxID=3365598 RepID=UPI003792CE9A
MDTSWIIFGLALGAVLRISRLIVDDDLTAPLRDRLHRRVHRGDGRTRPVAAFVTRLVACTWCTSVWVAFGVLAPVYGFYGYGWSTYPLAALTMSWATGILASWLDSPPPARHLIHHVAGPVTANVRSELAEVPGQTSSK